MEPPATGPAAGPLSYPDAKIATTNGASRPSAPAINPDERSGLGIAPGLISSAGNDLQLLMDLYRAGWAKPRDDRYNHEPAVPQWGGEPVRSPSDAKPNTLRQNRSRRTADSRSGR